MKFTAKLYERPLTSSQVRILRYLGANKHRNVYPYTDLYERLFGGKRQHHLIAQDVAVLRARLLVYVYADTSVLIEPDAEQFLAEGTL